MKRTASTPWVPRFLKLLSILLVLMVVLILGWYLASLRTEDDSTIASAYPPLKIAVDIWPGNFWIIVADRKGWFEEEGVSVELVDVSDAYDASIDDLVAGRLDADLLSMYDLVERNSQGADLVAIFVTDYSEGAEGIVAKSDYARLRDLTGKRVGVEIGTYLDFYLDVAMTNEGLAEADYTKVDIVTEQLPALFKTEALDAAIGWEPYLGQAMTQEGLSLIFSAADIEGLSPSVFVIKRTFLQSRRQEILRLVRVWLRTTQFIKEYPQEALSLVSQFDFREQPGSFYSVEELKDFISIDPLAGLEENLNAFTFSAGSESLYGNLQNVTRYLQRKKKEVEFPDINLMLDPSFIRSLP